MYRSGAIVAGVVTGLAIAPTGARSLLAQQSVVRCQTCHGNVDYLTRRAGGVPADSVYFVPDTLLLGTRHASLACASCHPDHERGYPHVMARRAVPCRTCHELQGEDWGASVHVNGGSGDAPDCVTCHTAHRVLSADDRRSLTHAFNVATLCGSCHADPAIIGEYFQSPGETQARTAVREYYQTVHGDALVRSGLPLSATCNDCHGEHKVLPAESPGSMVHRDNVATTCGSCHVGILEAWQEGSAHGTAYRTNPRTPLEHGAPTCVDCHSSHQIVRADEPEWFLGVVEECGSCHERVYETYFDTYHGQVTALGFELTAKCSDCHTPHNMQPASNPASSIFPTNLVETCARCHPDANTNFVRYYAHGDHRDRARYPLLFWPWLFMTTLLVGVWGFFALHSVCWLNGVRIERKKYRAVATRTSWYEAFGGTQVWKGPNAKGQDDASDGSGDETSNEGES